MSAIVLDELGARAAHRELVAVVETVSCPVDGIQVLLDCTFGKKNLIHKASGKPVFTFYHQPTKRAIQIARKQDVEPRRPESPRDRRDHIAAILNGGRDLFTVQNVPFAPPE